MSTCRNIGTISAILSLNFVYWVFHCQQFLIPLIIFVNLDMKASVQEEIGNTQLFPPICRRVSRHGFDDFRSDISEASLVKSNWIVKRDLWLWNNRTTPRSRGFCVMVWVRICASGKTPQVFLKGVKISAEVYCCDILEAVVLPPTSEHFGGKQWTLQ